ncbi:MAG: TraR/DksA family transcriptional regulator [Porticoccaceae bacterium]|jgi:RNA polymerase-binding protein DksA|nr:TraR/DksA family transcriptional regulator [Porticoccaceae bacterium]MEA3299198.1 TraR/DksA family transcriptional regulator [Pseudomonadota bacterium]HLS98877.1 TraR/DksA family transcriptional regulator [Porticoccaceae bacterium]
MTAAPLQDIEARLRARQQQLMTRIEQVKKDVTSEHSADWSEQAQERQNDEVVEAIGNESRGELRKVTRALERIAAGQYTQCASCGEDIDLKRLDAVPYTDLCIRCASR